MHDASHSLWTLLVATVWRVEFCRSQAAPPKQVPTDHGLLSSWWKKRLTSVNCTTVARVFKRLLLPVPAIRSDHQAILFSSASQSLSLYCCGWVSHRIAMYIFMLLGSMAYIESFLWEEEEETADDGLMKDVFWEGTSTIESTIIQDIYTASFSPSKQAKASDDAVVWPKQWRKRKSLLRRKRGKGLYQWAKENVINALPSSVHSTSYSIPWSGMEFGIVIMFSWIVPKWCRMNVTTRVVERPPATYSTVQYLSKAIMILIMDFINEWIE